MDGYPGLSGGGESLPGGEPLLGGAEAGFHLLSALVDQSTAQHSAGIYNGDLEKKATLVIEGLMTNLVTGVLNQMSQKAEWRPVMDGIHDLVTQMTPGMGANTDAPNVASRQAVQPAPPEAQPEPQPAPAEPPQPGRHKDPGQAPVHPLTAYREGREQGQKMTMGSIAKRVAEPLAKRVSDVKTEWVPVTLDDGREALRQIDTTTGGRVHDPVHGFVPDVAEGDEGFDSLTRRVGRQAMVRGVASGVLGGAGIAGSLGTVAAKVAGPIGLVVGGAQAGANWLENQNAAATPYRALYGESTSPLAAKERLGTWVEGMKGWGNIGADEARAQYRKASEMGLVDDGRDEATDFMRDMQRRFGMSTDASAGIVGSALSQGGGTAALDDFAEAITNVSRAAVEAGRTSSEAINQFVGAQAAVARLTPGAQASTQLASGITQMSLSLPQSLSEALGGAEGMASGMLTQNNVMAMAALSGQSGVGALFNMSDPGTAYQQGALTMEGIGSLLVRQAANLLGMSEEEFGRTLSEATGGQKVSDEEQFAIIRGLAGPERGGQLLLMLNTMASSFLGKPVPQNELINLLFEAATGAFRLPTQPQSSGASGSALTGEKTGGVGNAQTGPLSYGKASGSKELRDLRMDLIENTGRGTLGNKPSAGYGIIGGVPAGAAPQGEAFDAYLDYVAKTGKGDAGLEMLLNPGNKDKILKASGVSSIDDVKFRVGDKDMTMEEAIQSGKGSALAGASIVNTESPQEQPTAVRVVLDLTPDAKDFVQPAPTDDQRSADPPRSSTNPKHWYNAGGRS